MAGGLVTGPLCLGPGARIEPDPHPLAGRVLGDLTRSWILPGDLDRRSCFFHLCSFGEEVALLGDPFEGGEEVLAEFGVVEGKLGDFAGFDLAEVFGITEVVLEAVAVQAEVFDFGGHVLAVFKGGRD